MNLQRCLVSNMEIHPFNRFCASKSFRIMRSVSHPKAHCGIVNIIFTVLDCNTMQFAILRRDALQLEQIIKLSPSTVHFQNAMGQSPLHVAADWPWAIALLLENGADPYLTDSYLYTAIDYACRLGNYDAVKILLDEGSPLPRNGPLRQIIRCQEVYYSEQTRLRIFRLIISHLAIRRRELLHIARTLLPEARLSSILPPNETVPDSNAYQLIAAVREAGHATKPEYWYDDDEGLYQSSEIFPAAADVLYEAGFTHLEGQGRWGATPITVKHTSAMIVWLYQRGASFADWTSSTAKQCTAPFVPSMYLAIQGLAESVYDYRHYRVNDTITLRPLIPDDFEALNILLQDNFSDYRDLCKCLCSAGGCSPEVIMLKAIQMRIIEWRVSRWELSSAQPLPTFIQLVDKTLVEFEGRLASSILVRLSQAAIRMVLFSDLGIRHLCCEFWYHIRRVPLICQEEADEIREEDRLLAEQFEVLLPEAQLAWGKSSKRLTEFWREFHRANICRRRNGPADETNLAKLRDLGVMIHERGDEEMYCDSLYGDEEGYCESLSEDEEEADWPLSSSSMESPILSGDNKVEAKGKDTE